MRHSIAQACLVLAAAAVPCLADNPIIQTVQTADPSPMVHGDRVYLYTGHDEDKSTWFVMKDWRVFSSADMVNWTDHGSPLSLKTFDWATKDAWAGQPIERDGKFYWYVPVTGKGGQTCIGVAVGDSPTGPFKDAIGKPLIAKGSGNIDPTVFIDDDGQAYLYWGNPALKYVKLNKDMISYDESVGINTVEFTPENFGKRTKEGDKRTTLYEEGPWLMKRNSLYYMVFAAGGIPEYISYSTGPSATGPWTYRGIIMPTEGRSFTNHPGIADFKGKSYFFYHNGALPGGNGFNRSVCVEEFKYNDDGTFPTIKMTKEGPAPVGHLNPYEKVEAETIAWTQGVETAAAAGASNGVYVTDVSDGDYIKVKSVDFGSAGAAKFTANVAGLAGGTIEVHLEKEDGPLAAKVEVAKGDDAEKWNAVSGDVTSAVAGVHDVFLVFKGTGDKLFNFDWWQFATK